ncbi:MAG: hypothetical protein ACTHJ4_00365 [Candidatus Nucleicultricaceae bacterium]
MIKTLSFIGLLITLSPTPSEAFLGIGGGYDKRGEHCDGICNIVEYNCDLKKQAYITPSDMLERDKKKLPRVLTQNFTPSEMRAWCKKNCFHKSPWKNFKTNPDDYYTKLCTPSAATTDLANERFTHPILAPEQYFHFRHFLPETLTPLNLKMLDDTFIKQTGGDERRAIGSVEFVGLLYQVIIHNKKVGTLTPDQMDALAIRTFEDELKATGASASVITQYNNTFTVSQSDLSKVLKSFKAKIFAALKIKESEITPPKF